MRTPILVTGLMSLFFVARAAAKSEPAQGMPTDLPHHLILELSAEGPWALPEQGPLASALREVGFTHIGPLIDSVHVQVLRDLHELASAAWARDGRTGPAPSDLSLFFRVFLDGSVDVAAACERLGRTEGVELAYPAPGPALPPADPAPKTLDYRPSQTYFSSPSPTGLGLAFLQALPGGCGAGIAIADVEYSWRRTHEDLQNAGLTHVGLAEVDPFNDPNHGTAVLSILGGDENIFGVSGGAGHATLFTAAASTASGYSPANGIVAATAVLGAGDVLLIEQQACGPLAPGGLNGAAGCGAGLSAVPVEWNAAEYNAVAQATALGIIVVEAAGNGGNNLDDPVYLSRFNRATRDSGAIMIGAANPATLAAEAFSNHGSRVDVQGWGRGIVAAGYGDLFRPGDPNQTYTAVFAGTSGASATIAALAAGIEGVSLAVDGRTLSPQTLRATLVATGAPQTGTNLVGPRPDARAALAALRLVSGSVFDMQSLGAAAGAAVNGPDGIIAADLTGDDILDLVTASSAFGEIVIFPGLANGNFATPLTTSLSTAPNEIAADDLDIDGDLDLVATDTVTGRTTVWLNSDGLGTLVAGATIVSTGPVYSVATDDFDGDGIPDLLLGIPANGHVRFLLGVGDGTFTAQALVSTGSSSVPRGLVARDFDGDGNCDLAVAVSGFGAGVRTFIGDGTGNFTPRSAVNSVSASALACADVDSDGDLDLVASDFANLSVLVVTNDGTGSLTLAQTISTPFGFSATGARGVAVRDLSGDGEPDIVAVGPWDRAHVLPNDGMGRFSCEDVLFSTAATGTDSFGVALVDLAQDGALDVAVTHAGGAVGLFENRALFSPDGDSCRRGLVNARLCPVADVLFVDGSRGDARGVVSFAASSSANPVLSMAMPPAGPASSPFVLYAHVGPILRSDSLALPKNLGTVCFPNKLTGGLLSQTVTLANSIGFRSKLGTPLLGRVGAAPTTVMTLGNLGAGTYVLQGLIRDDGALRKGYSVTNLVELRVTP